MNGKKAILSANRNNLKRTDLNLTDLILTLLFLVVFVLRYKISLQRIKIHSLFHSNHQKTKDFEVIDTVFQDDSVELLLGPKQLVSPF